jgi:hypothetical protein
VLSHEPWLIPTTIEVWVGTVGLGIIWIVTGLTIIYGFARVDASLGSIVMLAEIPLALLMAYLVYQETLSPHQILGGILIFIAILLPELADKILEQSKPLLTADEASARASRARLLLTLLDHTLRLLHPFMPFVTEEIYQSLPHKGARFLMVTPWPVVE